MSEELIKIAVLEQKLIDFGNFVGKLDNAIEKISEVNTNITKMLAVHDEKIDSCNKSDAILIKLIDDLKSENHHDHQNVHKRIDDIEERIHIIQTDVSEISKIKWMTIGCGIVLSVLAAAFSTLASGWWSPFEMQMQRQGHLHQQNVLEDK